MLLEVRKIYMEMQSKKTLQGVLRQIHLDTTYKKSNKSSVSNKWNFSGCVHKQTNNDLIS